MAEITAKDVQALRQATGAGILDAKRPSRRPTATSRPPSSGSASTGSPSPPSARTASVPRARSPRCATATSPRSSQLRCETDFVAKSAEFVALVDEIAARVASDGEERGADEFTDEIDKLYTTLKENIALGRVVRLEAEDGQVLDSYLHVQNGRGVNGVGVELEGGDESLAHEIAVHIAFASPRTSRREDVPAAEVDARARDDRGDLAERGQARGRARARSSRAGSNGWYKERVLLEQPYVKDEKQTIAQLLGAATIVALRPGRRSAG